MGAQNRSDRRRNLSRREPRRRYLIEQWLKSVVILPVNYRDLDRSFRQVLRDIKPPETCADNCNPWYSLIRHLAVPNAHL